MRALVQYGPEQPLITGDGSDSKNGATVLLSMTDLGDAQVLTRPKTIAKLRDNTTLILQRASARNP